MGEQTYYSLPNDAQKSLMQLCLDGVQLRGADVWYAGDGRWLRLLYFLINNEVVSPDVYHEAVRERILEIGKAMLELNGSICFPVMSLPSPHALGAVIKAVDEFEGKRDFDTVSEIRGFVCCYGESWDSLSVMVEELGVVPEQLLELAKQAFEAEPI